MKAKTTPVKEIRTAYEHASGGWTGCDWTTDHGATNLNLDGCDPADLRKAADLLEDGKDCPDDIPQADSVEDLDLLPPDYTDAEEAAAYRTRLQWWIGDLRSGADWLDECSSYAEAAQDAADEAMEAIEEGRLDDAVTAARRASSLESEYGDDPNWGEFRRLIESAAESID